MMIVSMESECNQLWLLMMIVSMVSECNQSWLADDDSIYGIRV